MQTYGRALFVGLLHGHGRHILVVAGVGPGVGPDAVLGRRIWRPDFGCAVPRSGDNSGGRVDAAAATVDGKAADVRGVAAQNRAESVAGHYSLLLCVCVSPVPKFLEVMQKTEIAKNHRITPLSASRR